MMIPKKLFSLLSFCQLCFSFQFSYLGHDISSLIMLETEQNASYVNLEGEIQPMEQILAAGGANTARMRVWVNPIEGVYGLEYTLELAKRAVDAGLKVYLDFHYSDSWADPHHQDKPAAWENLTLNALSATLKSYTSTVVSSFYEKSIPVSLVSIGNEIRNGLLWPTGFALVPPTTSFDYPWNETVPETSWGNLALLMKAASDGVKEGCENLENGFACPEIGVHIDDGYLFDTQSYFYDNVFSTGHFSPSDFDIQMISYYPFYDPDAALSNLSLTTKAMAEKWGKPILVVETDWPYECTNTTLYPFPEDTESIPFSAEGQIEWTEKILDIVADIPGQLGKGLVYWEPGYLNNTGLGSECEDVLLFDGDWSNWPDQVLGVARDSVNMFKGYL